MVDSARDLEGFYAAEWVTARLGAAAQAFRAFTFCIGSPALGSHVCAFAQGRHGRPINREEQKCASQRSEGLSV